MKESRDRCVAEPLAQEGPFRVERCGHCNTLAVQLGAITLRFDAETLETLWNVIGQALLSLHRAQKSYPVSGTSAQGIGQA